jgi:hypothetical protein
LDVTGSTSVEVCNNTFRNLTSSGVALSTSNTQGTLEGNLFNNVSASLRYYYNPPNPTLGFNAAPTWTADGGTFVQDLNPVQSQNPTSDNIRRGWRYDATAMAWNEERFQTAAEWVGTAQPTSGTWSTGAVMKNTAPSEAGTTGAKYVVTGWICTMGGSPGTWLPMRSLTGN